jgi:DNA-binding response OmpR family regulator
MRILIIEDDPKMSIVLRDALEKQAHRIVLASSGTEGLPPKASSTHSNRPTSTITSLAGPYPLAQMLGLPS